MQRSRSGKRIAVLLLGLSLSLAGCGFSAETSSQPNGRAATLNLSLKTVPTVRSITISPGKATFANCAGGKGNDNTASAGSRLGYPNGVCWIGESSPIGLYPVKVTNTGIASFVYVNGSNATPSDSGDDWWHPITVERIGGDPGLSFEIAGSAVAEPTACYDAVFAMAVFRHGGLGEDAGDVVMFQRGFESVEIVELDDARRFGGIDRWADVPAARADGTFRIERGK